MSLPKQSLLSLLVPKFILALPHGRCFGTHIEATIAGTPMWAKQCHPPLGWCSWAPDVWGCFTTALHTWGSVTVSDPHEPPASAEVLDLASASKVGAIHEGVWLSVLGLNQSA